MSQETSNFGKMIRAKIIEKNLAAESDLMGCPIDDIERIKAQQGVVFLPKLYVEFLGELGEFAGLLFLGSDYNCSLLGGLKNALNFDLTVLDHSFRIPQDAFVFLAHQGYQFWYFHTAEQIEDPSVYEFYEEFEAPKKVDEHLSDFLKDAVSELL